MPVTNLYKMQTKPFIPKAPRAIIKGSSLAALLDRDAIDCLVHNISLVYSSFDGKSFKNKALDGIGPLGILERGNYLAQVLQGFLPKNYSEAVEILLASLTPPLTRTDEFGLSGFFYLPHVCFIAQFGLDKQHNGGRDPFDASMKAQYELTRRFSAEFSMRVFLIKRQDETLDRLMLWTGDRDPHVRRLCSEGSRPRLPWAIRIPAFIKDPSPVLPILEALKDDQDLYVRRSVANHVGDIAKDHPKLAFDICERWLKKASLERKWLIRHALRHPSKKGVQAALKLRKLAE